MEWKQGIPDWAVRHHGWNNNFDGYGECWHTDDERVAVVTGKDAFEGCWVLIGRDGDLEAAICETPGVAAIAKADGNVFRTPQVAKHAAEEVLRALDSR